MKRECLYVDVLVSRAWVKREISIIYTSLAFCFLIFVWHFWKSFYFGVSHFVFEKKVRCWFESESCFPMVQKFLFSYGVFNVKNVKNTAILPKESSPAHCVYEFWGPITCYVLVQRFYSCAKSHKRWRFTETKHIRCRKGFAAEI